MKVSKFKLITGTEACLRPLPPKKMLVDEIIGKHKIVALSADTNVGKSLYAHQLGIALAVGYDEIFGFPIDRPCRVLFLNFEMDDFELLERQQLFIKDMPKIYHQNLDNFMLNTMDGERTLFQDNWDSIEETIKLNDPFDLIIIDNLYACTGIDDEKNKDLKPMLKRIISISDIHNSSMLIVTHHKKHLPDCSLSIDLIRGGSTFANACDVIIQLAESRRDNGVRLMKITKNRGKSENKGKVFAMTLNENLWFEMHGEADERMHLSERSPLSKTDRLLSFLPDRFNTSDYLDVLANESTEVPRTGHNHLKKLVDKGEINKIKSGVYEKSGTVG